MKRWFFVIAIYAAFNRDAFSQDVNADLCQLGKKSGNVELLSSRPTAEVASYLAGLTTGKYSFAWTLDGHEAATQLGLSNRFATIYAELAEEAKLRIDTNGSVNISEIIDYLRNIYSQEKTVDALAMHKDKRFSSIVYLRALQNTECAFPNIYYQLPTSRVVLEEIIRSYPELKLEDGSATFAQIYDKTIKNAQARAAEKKSVSIYRTIEDLRAAILQ